MTGLLSGSGASIFVTSYQLFMANPCNKPNPMRSLWCQSSTEKRATVPIFNHRTRFSPPPSHQSRQSFSSFPLRPENAMSLRLKISIFLFIASSLVCFQARGICKLSELGNGRWVPHQPKSKSFVCCPSLTSPISSKFPVSNNSEVVRQCGMQYLENNNLYERSDNVSLNLPTEGARCACDIMSGAIDTPSDLEKWKWVPTTCDMMEWNPLQFCQLLGSRQMLFVGDSLMRDTITTVNNLLLHPYRLEKCASQLHFAVVFNISNYAEYKVRTAILQDIKPDIIMMNVGAHIHSRDLYEEHIYHIMDLIDSFRRASSKPLAFIWKSNVAPHTDCNLEPFKQNYAHPLTEEIPLGEDSPYHWGYLKYFDELAQNATAQHNVTFFDLRPLRLRADSHPGRYPGFNIPIDCLHHCIPGPVNIVANYLLHYLFWHRGE